MLKGLHVNLRTVRSKDLEHFLELSSDIESRGEHYPLHLQTETSIRARFEKDSFWGDDSGVLFIVDKQSDRILGTIVFFKPVHYYNALEIGYIIFSPRDRGKGYLTEALRLFTKYLFDLKPISRIQIQAEPGNGASRKVAEKCGYLYEGTARAAIISRGKAVDIDVLALTRSDFEALDPGVPEAP